ncbi:hypothetical protein [Paenibacillus humicola]|uniref:hypothetical protein n=1 Tax=Paenibacillus humicola TaxID=3110540 RepID=UPI00237A7F10|nr:hypothetical protein [Paenibacillus humicola]
MAVAISVSNDKTRLGLALGRLHEALAGIGETWEYGVPDSPASVSVMIASGAEEAALLGLTPDPNVRAEGFEIRTGDRQGVPAVYVLAPDETGAMYGVFELAERIEANGSLDGIEGFTANARFPFRALKFNLPWSSYRMGGAFDLQHQAVRDLGFWRGFLDMMAENRYNALTLWNLHPFPYMFRPKNFPKACPLTDDELAVWRTYWTSLFRMAKERGIETYMVNWNIFVSDAFKEHYDGDAVSDLEHYFGDSYSTDEIKRYTRECVTQMIDEYPDLTGIGTSLGERMHDMTPQDRQTWIEDVYYEGMKRAGRPVKFIHRAPFSVDPHITRDSIERSGLPEPVWVEVKFNWSHAYSSPELMLTHGGSAGMEGYWNPQPSNYKITWMVRNEDFFTLRWAQLDFVRAHIAANGHDYVGGYYVGSECFVPADDYSHVKDHPHMEWEYAYEKNWLYYMLWGRLLYDPETPDAVFEQAIGRRYGKQAGGPLLRAYSSVCGMPMALASFFAFTWDFTLYAEGFISSDNSKCDSPAEAFISLEDMLESRTFDPAYLPLREFAEREARGDDMEGRVTPLALADRLEADAKRGLELLKEIDSPERSALECEKADIEAWASLGLYFAAKLRAGVCCARYERTGDAAELRKAAEWIGTEHAAGHWERLVAVTKEHYREQPLLHLGATPFTWELFRPQVAADIDFVNGKGAMEHVEGDDRRG